MPDLTADRLRLFAFTQADNRERYLELLRAFNESREQSRLQLSPSDFLASTSDMPSAEVALAALDQLYDWGLVDRVQDDRRVRTIAEYRQRRSMYQMTELGWLAWDAVERVLAAEPGEAELRRLVLPLVLEQIGELQAAVRSADGERAALILDQVHRTLSDLAHHAARFTLATSELASAWEADPRSFLDHKNRLLGHLDGFLAALSEHRPALASAVATLDQEHETMIDLVSSASPALDGEDRARIRTERHWRGVCAWFLDAPGQPSQAAQLEERTSRAIRDLAVLLKRVLDTTAGGISRATQLEDLAAWFMACPDDETAHALAAAASGLRGVLHFGAPEADPDATSPSTSWLDAPPSPVDITLRKRGRRSASPPAGPIPNKQKQKRILRQRQADERASNAKAGLSLVHALDLDRPLSPEELAVLLRLLSRALHTRRPAAGSAQTVRGRLRLRVIPEPQHTAIQTELGTLLVEGHRVEVSSSGAPL